MTRNTLVARDPDGTLRLSWRAVVELDDPEATTTSPTAEVPAWS